MAKSTSGLIDKGRPYYIPDIIGLLNEYRIPMELWDNGSIKYLVNTLNLQDAFIRESEDGLVVQVKTVAISILNDEQNLRLHKISQKDGSEKKTDHIWRFCQKEERGFSAAEACVMTHLGFNQSRVRPSLGFGSPDVRDPVDSPEWPGIKLVEDRQWFKYIVPADMYSVKGYTDRINLKKSRFVWEPYK